MSSKFHRAKPTISQYFTAETIVVQTTSYDVAIMPKSFKFKFDECVTFHAKKEIRKGCQRRKKLLQCKSL